MSARILPLVLEYDAGIPRSCHVGVEQAVIAGWTGRDALAVEKHIRELEALGVKRPAATPIFYRVSAARLTTDARIEVLGNETSGEVEFVLLQSEGTLWVGAGSDHTDRKVEAYGVSVSKQICEKPVAPSFWPFDAVAAHWDRLLLRSYATIDGNRGLYQEGSVGAILHPEDLLSRFARNRIPEGLLMFCGTVGVHGGLRPAQHFEFELEDPVRGQKIHHGYEVASLPILG